MSGRPQPGGVAVPISGAERVTLTPGRPLTGGGMMAEATGSAEVARVSGGAQRGGQSEPGVGHQSGGLGSHRVCDLGDVEERHVAFATLNLAHMRAVYSGRVRQGVLS